MPSRKRIFSLDEAAFRATVVFMIDPEITQLKDEAAQRGLSFDAVLAHVGIAKTTYWRWEKRGYEPKLSTLRKMRAAIDELAGGR